ncbi:serine/threonine-protein kinase [Paenibacillus sp. JMULE4]|uniref:serine/threonine protein kinase n=1 Tax=Paenibacillus TaxID=44249 RepID=UPI001577013E|nr:protein kinase [Paenibacillus sp. JMULE4]NTZ20384.1 serine/threonine-protein kinase [Paenibacillus sp. JMULE4]
MLGLGYIKQVYQAWIDYPWKEGLLLADRYEIIEFLGEGSYGLTYLCQDTVRGDKVVVKQAKPSKGKRSRHLLEREMAILERLRHPNIPGCRGSFWHNKHLCMAVDWVEGHTVEDLLFEQNRGFSERESLEWIVRLMSIVRFVHAQGYVHLDIRIPNVMIRNGEPVLIDFGLARRVGDVDGSDTDMNEQSGIRRTPEVKSDLYAVGHFLLFMLYLSYEERPGQLEKDWQEELSLTSHTRKIVRRLLQIEPPYEDASSLIRDLKQALRTL